MSRRTLSGLQPTRGPPKGNGLSVAGRPFMVQRAAFNSNDALKAMGVPAEDVITIAKLFSDTQITKEIIFDVVQVYLYGGLEDIQRRLNAESFDPQKPKTFLFSGREHAVVEEAKRQNMMSERGDTGIKVKEGNFKCRKCDSWKVTSFRAQTRSADEPMTIFTTCVVCGAKDMR
jgi:DNA-directed RNA polymerase subunit M/transcription elongation factor TFIIS